MFVRKIEIFGILFLLIVGYTAYYGHKNIGPEEKQVIKVFEKYNKAKLKHNYKDAVKLVDSRTIQYYSDLLELAKSADSAEIEKLSIYDKFNVLQIRHFLSEEEILSFDGRSLFARTIKSLEVDNNDAIKASVGEVTINKKYPDFAKVQFAVNGQKLPMYCDFYKEYEGWKIDLTSLHRIITRAYEQAMRESQMTPNEYLFWLLETQSGRKPEHEIWKPVGSSHNNSYFQCC